MQQLQNSLVKKNQSFTGCTTQLRPTSYATIYKQIDFNKAQIYGVQRRLPRLIRNCKFTTASIHYEHETQRLSAALHFYSSNHGMHNHYFWGVQAFAFDLNISKCRIAISNFSQYCTLFNSGLGLVLLLLYKLTALADIPRIFLNSDGMFLCMCVSVWGGRGAWGVKLQYKYQWHPYVPWLCIVHVLFGW